MSYSEFTTIGKAVEAFNLTIEEKRFLAEIEPVSPSTTLTDYLASTLPLASSGSEKARSEGIIYPLLIEVRRILEQRVSVFSGEDFSIDESIGLNGIVDFLVSRSPQITTIQAPAVVIVEAKKADIRSGMGQCIAEMVAAQKFNEAKGKAIAKLYGAVSSGTQWRFLKLSGQTVTIDLMDYPLPPVDQILGFLVWMVKDVSI